MKARSPGIAEIEPRMKHGWNTTGVTAPPKAFGATGRAKLLLSPIFAPSRFPFPSVFNPRPQNLRGGFMRCPKAESCHSRSEAKFLQRSPQDRRQRHGEQAAVRLLPL